jgi:hypothetical protein
MSKDHTLSQKFRMNVAVKSISASEMPGLIVADYLMNDPTEPVIEAALCLGQTPFYLNVQSQEQLGGAGLGSKAAGHEHCCKECKTV